MALTSSASLLDIITLLSTINGLSVYELRASKDYKLPCAVVTLISTTPLEVRGGSLPDSFVVQVSVFGSSLSLISPLADQVRTLIGGRLIDSRTVYGPPGAPSIQMDFAL